MFGRSPSGPCVCAKDRLAHAHDAQKHIAPISHILFKDKINAKVVAMHLKGTMGVLKKSFGPTVAATLASGGLGGRRVGAPGGEATSCNDHRRRLQRVLPHLLRGAAPEIDFVDHSTRSEGDCSDIANCMGHPSRLDGRGDPDQRVSRRARR